MLSENSVYRSAFTPAGWVEPKDDFRPPVLLVHTPPVRTDTAFWDNCFSASVTGSAAEVYLDPFAPGWLEGMNLKSNDAPIPAAPLILKTDSLHPRTCGSAPFFDEVLDLYAKLLPQNDRSRSDGLVLLQRRKTALSHAQCSLELAQAFFGENLRIAAAKLKIPMIHHLADRLYETILTFPKQNTPTASLAGTRFFSAITAIGPVFCEAALHSRATTVFHLADEYGAASRMLLYQILRTAVQDKETVCIGRCPMFWPDKIDHLIFPARGVLLTVQNSHHRLRTPGHTLQCHTQLMSSLKTEQLQRIRYNCTQASKQLSSVQRSLREVWRTQTALADLCPISLSCDRFPSTARNSIVTKNNAET